MPVEIREIVLQARVVDDGTLNANGNAQTGARNLQDQLDQLRLQMLAECEKMVRDALDSRSAR